MFDINDEHLQTNGIKDFEILNVYIDTYYYVYISSNDKVYEYVLDYTGTKIDNISKIVSILSIIGLGVLVLWKRK